MTRKPLLLLLGVLGVQLFLSFQVFTPAPHTGGDNAGYVSLAYSILERGAYLELWAPGEPPHTKYPPVFPLLLAGAMALGVKTWSGLKVIPFLSTLVVGCFTFLWVRNRKGVGFAAAIAVLVALSDATLYYSRWVLSDPVFVAFTLGALWAFERAPEKNAENEKLWIVGGALLVLLAYFTRSAGLPLVVAAVLSMALRRAWGRVAIFSVSALALAGVWWWRGAGIGPREYVAEFWLIDPYRPDLGRVGPAGLVVRVWENLWAYVTNLIPEGMVGLEGPFLPALGVGVTLLAAAGWIQSVRSGPRLAELFLPLYSGLLLLWPQVWSGDRFALPLFPLLLFYGSSSLARVLGRFQPALRNVALGGAFLAVALPALRNWVTESEAARECRVAAAGGDAWACHGLGVREYVLMADWAGRYLPEGAAVVTRKPRIFFVQSGVGAVPLPLTRNPEAFFDAVGEGGGEYLTLDRWDGLAGYYLPPILEARPESFCYLTGVESGGQVGIRLLGITGEASEPPGETGTMARCPPEMLAEEAPPRAQPSAGEVPLLARGLRGR